MRVNLLFLLGLGLVLGSFEAFSQDVELVATESVAEASAVESRIPLDEIRRYVAVYNAIKQAYVDPVDDEKLMQSAIEGLLLNLDPHSAYLNKKSAEAFDEQTQGAYEGVGVELLQLSDNTLKVIAVMEGMPAAKAGIISDDLVVAIDGKPMSEADGMEPLRGEVGTEVVLTIVRKEVDKPFDVTLVRDVIRIASVRSEILEPGYGYMQINTFQADTGADFQKQLTQLQEQAGSPLKGLVLDLRSNPGGLLNAAIQVADALLDEGEIVSTRGRITISDTRYQATPGDLLNGASLVVLVDAGSASASEVLAGALRDNQRARVVGSRTFGKGSVQTVLPLDNGDSVKLTTARYYTPSGRSIQASGILPDVILQPASVEGATTNIELSEAVLPGHLHGDQEGSLASLPASRLLPGDEPIQSALGVLKRMSRGR